MVYITHICALLLQAAPLLALSDSTISGDSLPLERRAPPTCTVTPVTPPGPPPKGFYCNKQGSVKRVAAIITTTKPNVNACRDLCLNDSRCHSFSYGPKRNCITSTSNIVDQGFTASNSGKFFWNRKCFKTTCTCPQGQTNCNNNNCVDLQSDEANCGSCGTALPQGQTCCSGKGVNTSTDPNNCGGCGLVPTKGQACCNGQIMNTTADDNNCGACGLKCTDGPCYRSVCTNCMGNSCGTSFVNCNPDISGCGCIGINDKTAEYGRCNTGAFSCDSATACTDTSDCEDGFFCGYLGPPTCVCTKNGGSLCLPYDNICINPDAPGRLFRRNRAVRSIFK